MGEGTLFVLGGPLKERWLYAQPRDEEMLPERIQFTIQHHADATLSKTAPAQAEGCWTEDCEGLVPASSDVGLAASGGGRETGCAESYAPEVMQESTAGVS